MFSEMLSDFVEAWRLGSEVRNPNWYLMRGYITPSECLWLERYPEHGAQTNAN